MKKVLVILTILISSFLTTGYAYETIDYGVIKAESLNDKVYDYADIFTPEEETKIKQAVKDFIKKQDTEFIIVTINSNPESSYNGQNPSTVYADDFYDYNGFGFGANHDGLILLIDMDYRVFVITTTGRVKSELPNDYLETIYNNMDQYMLSGEYYEACKVAINKVNDIYYLKDEIKNIPIDSKDDIFDFKNTLSVEEKNKLAEYSKKMEELYDIDLLFFVSDSNSALTSFPNFADLLYTSHEFKDNGIIINMTDSYSNISCHGTACDKINPTYFSKLTDELRDEDNDTFFKAFDETASDILEYYEHPALSNIKLAFKSYGLIIFIISTIIAIIYAATRKKAYTVSLLNNANSYLSGVEINNKKDTYINTTTSRVYSPMSSSGSGGGSSFSGGSHVSHSGISHGGGGGHHF